MNPLRKENTTARRLTALLLAGAAAVGAVVYKRR